MQDRQNPPDSLVPSLLFDVDVKMFHAVMLVDQAANAIVALERWKNDVGPQVAYLIQNIQSERSRWASERAELLGEIHKCRQYISLLQDRLMESVAQKEEMGRTCREMQTRSEIHEARARSAEDMLLKLYDAMKFDLPPLLDGAAIRES